MLSGPVAHVPFLLGLFAAVLSAQHVPDVVNATFGRAGDNRPQLERAWAQVEGAERLSLAFLLEHLPDADARSLPAELLLENVRLAHSVRGQVAWGDELSDELFTHYVLPYAQANERREAWRAWMVERFLPLVVACKTPGAAAQKLNESIFDLVGVHYSTERRRADQAPGDSIAQGKASCTGLSILLADACRACCVPARVISVRWPHKAGNHTWVEVWDGAAWRFCGADEPDPQGLDRAWFVGDAAKCADADRDHRIWAVSYAPTGERFAAGWARGVELWGVDVTERYAPANAAATGRRSGSGEDPLASSVDLTGQDPAAAALTAQLERYFAAGAERQATFEFDRNLDQELKTTAGDARLRALVWAALKAHDRPLLQPDHDRNVVHAGDKMSPFTIKEVGEKPKGGWPLVIAMHGGGNTRPEVNDSQWRHMQIYYKDHPEVGGYLYCALRAPTDEWNGFYTDYFYPLLEKLIRQFVVCSDVDPDRVIAIGYSHGGYGAFALGTKLPHRFAAVHASAAAPTDGQDLPLGLHSLPFSFMVGGKDTAYGRRARCEAFAAALAQQQQAMPGLYPTKFTLVEGNGHTGLPDRDLLAELVPLRRETLPTKLLWQLTDGTVRDHYWLHVREPGPAVRAAATCARDSIEFEVDGTLSAEAWLDARLIDMSGPIAFQGDGVRKVEPQPSLRTMCRTMQERGDPQLAASWILPLLASR